MKRQLTFITMMFLLVNSSFSQNLANVYLTEGKLFAQYDNGNVREIKLEGTNTLIDFSRNKNIVIYARLEQLSKNEGEEGAESYHQVSVRCFDLKSNKDVVLFKTCLDGIGGTRPDYANSSIYPNNNLCGIEEAKLSPDGDRLFFQTSGWATCPAIHFYNLTENKLVFFKPGWLQSVTKEGVEVQITGVETKNNRGEIESNGRYTQYCLFDFNGNLIKTLGPKEF